MGPEKLSIDSATDRKEDKIFGDKPTHIYHHRNHSIGSQITNNPVMIDFKISVHCVVEYSYSKMSSWVTVIIKLTTTTTARRTQREHRERSRNVLTAINKQEDLYKTKINITPVEL